MTKSKPIHEVRLGVIKAAIWANESEAGGVRYNVTLGRLYKDEEGQWKTTDGLGRDDLLVAAKVLDQAHTWIYERGRGSEPAE
jgi:hypothetical protein